MLKDLKLLLELQEIDNSIKALKDDQLNFPQEIERLKKEITLVESRYNESQERLKELQQIQEETMAMILEKKDALSQSQEKLKVIKTNKEYDAVHEEIESHESFIKNSDKKLSQVNSTIKELKEEGEILAEKLKTIQEKNAPLLNKLEGELESIEKKVNEENRKTEPSRTSINKRFLNLYQRIVKNRKNRNAIGLVTEGQRLCHYCYAHLPPQKYNEVKRNDDLILCTNCGSILIWVEDEYLTRKQELENAAEEPVEAQEQEKDKESEEQGAEAQGKDSEEKDSEEKDPEEKDPEKKDPEKQDPEEQASGEQKDEPLPQENTNTQEKG
jgi:predicted  nucleic acid-binding Zn-ribbon protein